MSIFGSIASAIFGKKAPGAAPLAPGAPSAPAQGTATAGSAPSTGKAMTQAEVEAMIKKIADGQRVKLNWQQSIVDLLKLLKLDSSLTARKHLAQELGYKGSLDGSAEMNIWLHKAVMTKLAKSGGVVPESLTQAGKLERKPFDKPDETRAFKHGKGKLDVVTVGDCTVGRGVFEPGWRWSEHVKPIVGTPSCQAAHTGYVLEGRMIVKMDDGAELEYGPGDAFYMPSGHDAWVVGDKRCVLIDFTGMAKYAKPV
jgi:quercetin dioxygenase-like cupin family protein